MRPNDHATIRGRIEQACKLVSSLTDELSSFRAAHAGEEIQRRELELVTRALLSWTRELARLLTAAKLRIGLEPCPGCGWERSYRSSARCPRCSVMREAEVPSEARGGNSRRSA